MHGEVGWRPGLIPGFLTSVIDIGVNLGNRAFASDREAVLQRARDVGVTGIVVTGTSVSASEEAHTIASEHEGYLWSTAGVHPHDAKTCDDRTLERLRELASRRCVVAIGECGLDFNRDFSPRPDQERWFDAQLGLAAELGMPVFLHERDASDRFLAILKDHRDRLPGAVVHCFTGEEGPLRSYLDIDCHIGITGWICDERRGTHLRSLVRIIPPERLMAETDAPFLLPRDLRPKPKTRRNEPMHLPHVVRTIAGCVGRPFESVAEETLRTTRAFFGLE